MTRRRTTAVVAMTGIAVLIAGCGDDAARPSAEVPNVFDLRHDPAADIAEVDPIRADVLPAGSLHAVLERQLAWHGVTLVEMMRAARRDDPQLRAWISALAGNSDDLVAAVGLVYGPAGARAFNQQWAQHTQFLLDYAIAVRDGDDGAAEQARTNLATYAADSASFFETATEGALPASAVQELLDTHVGHMFDMLAADNDGDAAATLDAAVLDNGYLLSIADGLASAMAGQFPNVFPGKVQTQVSMYCTIVTGQTGSYLLTDLISGDQAAVDEAAAAFGRATGEPIEGVLGPLESLSSDRLQTVATTAAGMLDSALEFASKR